MDAPARLAPIATCVVHTPGVASRTSAYHRRLRRIRPLRVAGAPPRLAAPTSAPNHPPGEEPLCAVHRLDADPGLQSSGPELIDAYWRAANYLSVGQIYLLDNPLLREPLRAEHVKPRLLGHWGTTLGLNLLYAHMNRVITQRDLNALYVTGPGHGGPGLVAKRVPGRHLQRGLRVDRPGLRRAAGAVRQFSFPGGIPSHVAPETPGSIHEGGELGPVRIDDAVRAQLKT